VLCRIPKMRRIRLVQQQKGAGKSENVSGGFPVRHAKDESVNVRRSRSNRCNDGQYVLLQALHLSRSPASDFIEIVHCLSHLFVIWAFICPWSLGSSLLEVTASALSKM
ncbi:hypothetical protein CLAIMM_07590, partial [Cladophialophora immunda]